LISGDIVSGQVAAVIYDGTSFQLLSTPQNPTTTSSPPTQNKLVYAEVTPGQTTGTLTMFTLPNYTFNSAKAYLLEMVIMPDTAGATEVQVALSDGTNTYTYPGTTTYVRAHTDYEELTVHKILPNLSGSCTLSIQAKYIGFVELKIFEINDNLVFADFAPAVETSTLTINNLGNFNAISGHTYYLVANQSGYTAGVPSMSVYLSDGTINAGLPGPDPTANTVEGPSLSGAYEASKVLTQLSGPFTVVTKSKYSAGVSVRIYDIT
jgi:hypothetical protein